MSPEFSSSQSFAEFKAPLSVNHGGENTFSLNNNVSTNKSGEIAQQMMFNHTTGVNILLSPRATEMNVTSVRNGEMTSREGERLRVIIEDGNLKKRYPTVEDGLDFMKKVDYLKRDEMFGYAVDMSKHIVEKWREINSEIPVAVILFGSVAKGLVKSAENPDPSNIDLAVIGTISDSERERLYDSIRERRGEIQQNILSSHSEIDSPEDNPGNVGVIIQDTHKVINGNFTAAINYIASCATPLHDDAGIWQAIEDEALERSYEKTKHKKKNSTLLKYGNPKIIIKEPDVIPTTKQDPSEYFYQTDSLGDMIKAEIEWHEKGYPISSGNPTEFELSILNDLKGHSTDMLPGQEYDLVKRS